MRTKRFPRVPITPNPATASVNLVRPIADAFEVDERDLRYYRQPVSMYNDAAARQAFIGPYERYMGRLVNEIIYGAEGPRPLGAGSQENHT